MFNSVKQLEHFSDEIRLMTLKMFRHRGSGYFGGSLSIIETLASLYGEIMNVDPGNPDCPDRDYFILSKGHAGAPLYATLSLIGYFPEDALYTIDGNGSSLPVYPDRLLTPGIEMTIGSPGYGLSVAAGIALSHKRSNSLNYTYCIVGDCELNEGECWETILFAGKQNLANLVVMVDCNHNSGLSCEDLAQKFTAFGFNASCIDGTSVEDITLALESVRQYADKPAAILLDTRKGQGVPYIENMKDSHFIELTTADQEALDQEIRELEERLERR